jgi:NAD(P)-dependent dehydrogenase (short-subunit alcohol dehydrogenase family)
MHTYAPAYSLSKAALNAVTRQFAGALPGIAVNSVCPGWVRTDMGGTGASRSIEKGAETIVWLATDAPVTETGKFWRDKKEIEW